MHGVAYDIVFNRRLWKDIRLRTDFSYYVMKEYTFVSKWSGAPIWGRDVTSVDEMHKKGVEVDITGHIIAPLGFYLSFSAYDYDNKDKENIYADEEFGNRAKYRVNAGLDYNLFKNTKILLDYKYQDEQVTTKHEGDEDDPPEFWHSYKIKVDAYHVFDLAVEQKLFEKWGFARNAVIKFYINNLLDEEYQEDDGYPATDRTFGVYAKLEF
jgi:iron complex outermembrane receptor protein